MGSVFCATKIVPHSRGCEYPSIADAINSAPALRFSVYDDLPTIAAAGDIALVKDACGYKSYMLCDDGWLLLSEGATDEPHRMTPFSSEIRRITPINCVNCCAPMRKTVCEYCGTDYGSICVSV